MRTHDLVDLLLLGAAGYAGGSLAVLVPGVAVAVTFASLATVAFLRLPSTVSGPCPESMRLLEMSAVAAC